MNRCITKAFYIELITSIKTKYQIKIILYACESLLDFPPILVANVMLYMKITGKIYNKRIKYRYEKNTKYILLLLKETFV